MPQSVRVPVCGGLFVNRLTLMLRLFSMFNGNLWAIGQLKRVSKSFCRDENTLGEFSGCMNVRSPAYRMGSDCVPSVVSFT